MKDVWDELGGALGLKAQRQLVERAIARGRKLERVAEAARELAALPVIDFSGQRSLLAEIRAMLAELDRGE